MDASSFVGTDIHVDPAAFCGVAARMLAAEGRDGVPAVLALLGQALQADVVLVEADSSRAPIPRPRLRAGGTPTFEAAPIDLPVRSRDAVLAVLSIDAPFGLPSVWTVLPGPLATVADLLALTLAAAPGRGSDSAADVTATARAWFEADELDRHELACQLHDGLVQSLVAARYLLDLACTTWPDGPQPWLEAVRESLQAALGDGRGLLRTVRPRTRNGFGLRMALSELCETSRIPVELFTSGGTDLEIDPQLSAVAAAAGFRFVQAALVDLMDRGGDAAEVRLTYGREGVSIDVCAIGEQPAWPDQPRSSLQRWATRIEMLGGTSLLQPTSAHLRFGPADGETAAQSSRDTRVERTL